MLQQNAGVHDSVAVDVLGDSNRIFSGLKVWENEFFVGLYYVGTQDSVPFFVQEVDDVLVVDVVHLHRERAQFVIVRKTHLDVQTVVSETVDIHKLAMRNLHLVLPSLHILELRSEDILPEVQAVLHDLELLRLLLLTRIDGNERYGVKCLFHNRILELEDKTVLLYVLRLGVHSKHA